MNFIRKCNIIKQAASSEYSRILAKSFQSLGLLIVATSSGFVTILLTRGLCSHLPDNPISSVPRYIISQRLHLHQPAGVHLPIPATMLL